MLFTLEGVSPPPNKPLVDDEQLIACLRELVKFPKFTPFPVDEMVIISIDASVDGTDGDGAPPPNIPRVGEEHPSVFSLTTAPSPKSSAFPIVAIVI